MSPKSIKTIHGLALYWQKCADYEKRENGAKVPTEIASYIADAGHFFNPLWEEWYNDARFPEVRQIFDRALDMEIDNGPASFHEWWAEMKQWINDLEVKTRGLS